MFFMPYPMPNGQQQGGNTMSMKDMKKLYKAFIMAQKEMEAAKKPEDKKPDGKKPEGRRLHTGEAIAYMWVLSPVIGLLTCNLYLYCFQQMKTTLSAFGAQ